MMSVSGSSGSFMWNKTKWGSLLSQISMISFLTAGSEMLMEKGLPGSGILSFMAIARSGGYDPETESATNRGT